MAEKSSVYICGPVTGTNDYTERFENYEQKLNVHFDNVINPVKRLKGVFEVPENIEWNILMIECLNWLSDCTHIFLMEGYEKSYGARIEKLWAEKLGLTIIK